MDGLLQNDVSVYQLISRQRRAIRIYFLNFLFVYNIVSSNSRAKTRCTGFYWHLLYDIVSSNSKKNAPAYKLVSSLATTLESSWIEWRQNTGGDKLCWNFLHGIVSSNSQAKTRCIGIFFVRGIVPSISQAKTKCIGIYWDFLLPHHVRATEGRRLQA